MLGHGSAQRVALQPAAYTGMSWLASEGRGWLLTYALSGGLLGLAHAARATRLLWKLPYPWAKHNHSAGCPIKPCASRPSDVTDAYPTLPLLRLCRRRMAAR